MRLLNSLQSEAVRRGLLEPSAALDAPLIFALVRDMPYRQASDRCLETIISEWRGTCLGKHYLLQALFAELGLASQLMACTAITPVDPADVPDSLLSLYERANYRFVDVHYYLWLSLPGGGQMVVDEIWPLSARDRGLVVNDTFE